MNALRVEERRHPVRHVLTTLGPGLITGAADDDPSGIATYSQTGAQFGYGQLWTAVWMLPLVIGVQEACARIGNVTGQGLSANIKQRYNIWILRSLVLLLIVANTINIGADIGAMGASAALIIPVPAVLLMVVLSVVILALEVRTSYKRYARYLKWLTVSLLVYPATALIVHEPWLTILRATFVPDLHLSIGFFYVLTAVIGTTISPYMFFWETSQEVEENRSRSTRRSLRDLRTDNALGMIASQVTSWFIIIVGGTVLHAGGAKTIRSAADAARALEPLVRTAPHAGQIAQGLFALGVVSLGMLAIPVLAGSSSFALSEARGKVEGLELKPRQARYFYAIIAASMVIGLALNLIGISPFPFLVFAAVFNGITAVPLIWIINRIATDERVMGQARSGRLSRTVLVLTFAGMAASLVATLASSLGA